MKTRILIFVLTLFCLRAHGKQSDFITYDSLVKSDYSDHVQSFNQLMGRVKIHSLLEFGLGHGTKFFLDHADTVTSVELLLPHQTEEWYNKYLQLYQDYDNWEPLLYRGSSALQKADAISGGELKDPSLTDGTYLLELKKLCNDLFSKKSYEVAFIDPGIHIRGDLVNELFDRVDIIVAHNTNSVVDA